MKKFRYHNHWFNESYKGQKGVNQHTNPSESLAWNKKLSPQELE